LISLQANVAKVFGAESGPGAAMQKSFNFLKILHLGKA